MLDIEKLEKIAGLSLGGFIDSFRQDSYKFSYTIAKNGNIRLKIWNSLNKESAVVYLEYGKNFAKNGVYRITSIKAKKRYEGFSNHIRYHLNRWVNRFRFWYD